jgi:hypothetical protein
VRFDGEPAPFRAATLASDLRFPDTIPYADDSYTAALIDLLQAPDPDALLAATPSPTKDIRRAHSRLAQFQWSEPEHRLYYRESTGHLRLVIPVDAVDAPPPSLRARLIVSEHEPADKGHRGADSTVARLQRGYYWEAMTTQVRALVAGCVCQGSKSSTSRPLGLLQPLEPPLRPHSHITMDLITGLEPSPATGFDTLLVVVCRLSKMVTLIPCLETLTATGTMDLLTQHVFLTHKGYPLSIVSDRDPRWSSHAFQEFCKSSGIKHSMSSANHPQSDGQTERTNRSIEEIARSYLSYDHAGFWDLLADIEFAINDSPLAAMDDMSPFEIACGQSPFRPTDILGGTWANDSAVTKPLRERLAHARWQRRLARELVRNASAKMAVQANKHRRAIPAALQPGAEVWVKTQQLMTPAQRAQVRAHGVRKFQQKYHGPYRVLSQVGNVSFKIALPKSIKAHPVIHADALKLHVPHNIAGLEPEVAEPLFVQDATGTPCEVHEVGALFDSRRRGGKRTKRTEYLAKWKFYPEAQATWVRFEDLGDFWQANIPAQLKHQPLAHERAALV